MPIEVVDPNASGNSAQKVKRVRGATLDADTAALVVALSDASGNTVTSLKTTAGGPAAGQAAKNYTGLIAMTGSTQNVAIETVTTGKTYFITDIIITGNPSAAVNVAIQAGGVTIFQGYVNATKGLEAIGLETQPAAVAGQAVTLLIPSGSGSIAFVINGVEQ